MEVVAQKVVRLVMGAGFFPSGNEHNLRGDADAASFVFANWPAPAQIVSVGGEQSQDVFNGPSSRTDPTTDPLPGPWRLSSGGRTVPAIRPLPSALAVR